MKPPPRRSARAAGAPLERKVVQPSMMRRAPGRPLRATARALLGGLGLLRARGIPAWAPSMLAGLRLLRARGMPAWTPSMLGGIRVRRGRGRLEDRMEVDPQPRRGNDRGGDPHGRGGQGDRRPPGGGGGRDPPARGVGDAPPDADLPAGRRVDDAPPDEEYIVDASQWIGIIDKDDLMGLEDSPVLYQPFFATVGKNQDDPKVIEINDLLVGVYLEMLGTYFDIYVASTKKWNLKRNLDELPWDLVQEMVQELDSDLKVSFMRYNASEKYSVALMEKIQKLHAEPLQRPFILEKGPGRFDFRKERKAILKQLRKEEKKIKIEKRGKKLKGDSSSSKKEKAESSSSKKKGERSSSKKKDESSSSKKKGGSSSSKKKYESSSSKKKDGSTSGKKNKKGSSTSGKRKESRGKADSGSAQKHESSSGKRSRS